MEMEQLHDYRVRLVESGATGRLAGTIRGTDYFNLRKLSTAHEDYAWVNPLEIWATGEAKMETQEATIRGYAAK